MQYATTTIYDKRVFLALNLVVRKTTQRRRFLLQHILLRSLGSLSILPCLLLSLIFSRLDLTERVICIGALLIGVIVLVQGIFLRRINAWTSLRHLTKGCKNQSASL